MRCESRSIAASWLGLATLLSSTAFAQDALLLQQLPEWAQQQFASTAKLKAVGVSTRINPFVWRGDFDGDKVQDFAVFIRDTKSKKEGIAILRRSRSTLVVGAGIELGNGGDDFSWLDMWGVIEGHGVEADQLFVAKESSASAIVSLKNDKPTWQQQGD